jgi:hypothetical protein
VFSSGLRFVYEILFGAVCSVSRHGDDIFETVLHKKVLIDFELYAQKKLRTKLAKLSERPRTKAKL